MLPEGGVVISKWMASADGATEMSATYGVGATMVKLEKNFELSHGAAFRALSRTGVKTRDRAPRL
jgi:hypothetical protein